MKLQVFLFAALVGTTVAADSDSSFGAGDSSRVCNVLGSGAVYNDCQLEWGMYNACHCYNLKENRDETCGKFLKAAKDCKDRCQKSKCDRVKQQPAPISEVCKVSHNGSTFKECRHDWANYNACGCYFKGDIVDSTTVCGYFKTNAQYCESKCAKDGNCKKN